MFAVRRAFEGLRPDRVIGGEIFLILTDDGDEEIFEHRLWSGW